MEMINVPQLSNQMTVIPCQVTWKSWIDTKLYLLRCLHPHQPAKCLPVSMELMDSLITYNFLPGSKPSSVMSSSTWTSTITAWSRPPLYHVSNSSTRASKMGWLPRSFVTKISIADVRSANASNVMVGSPQWTFEAGELKYHKILKDKALLFFFPFRICQVSICL